MYGAHECLVPVNYATTNVFKQLEEKQKAARNTRSCDYRHLLLLLPFILSNLFRDELEEHNSHHQGNPVHGLPMPRECAERSCDRFDQFLALHASGRAPNLASGGASPTALARACRRHQPRTHAPHHQFRRMGV
jgi:hypothetical protein